MGAPGRQAVDARLHGMAEEMPTHQRRQGNDILRTLLQQQQIGMMAFDEFRDILDAGADPPQQIPAHHAQAVIGAVIRKGGSHFWPVMRYRLVLILN